MKQAEKCQQFARLHQADSAWVIPNPWDVGSARLLQGLGFKALATTSSGFAYTLGLADGAVSLEQKLAHCTALAEATSIPINADFEDGFAASPEQLAANVSRLVATGVAGLSIEDFSRERQELYDFNHAVERVQAAAEAIQASGLELLLTARAENLLRGVNDLEDTQRRLQAYTEAGADVLYAPGLKTLDDLRQLSGPLQRPFNALAPFFKDVTVSALGEAGATRISVGGALCFAALKPLLDAGREMQEQGSFEWLGARAAAGDVWPLLK